ncbi:cytochrome c oxidase subunit 8A, mitochondrial [Melanotaenia boesemani]|uniref:cytochrome c oxidase subunit 8A, mitochondrial n=1 Tax=Melanotaenia boesemani TaxID=1250792 RepID=UPI001C043B57|nr:cytochrome c oxidase subunit 8A, mitochondrial [Melanotaenia boesemani]
MPGLLRTVAARSSTVLRGYTITQKASIYTRPPKDTIGAFETAVGMGLFSLAILGPSGWILAHLEDYKKRE